VDFGAADSICRIGLYLSLQDNIIITMVFPDYKRLKRKNSVTVAEEMFFQQVSQIPRIPAL
jgi:hypothetical protein